MNFQRRWRFLLKVTTANGTGNKVLHDVKYFSIELWPVTTFHRSFFRFIRIIEETIFVYTCDR